MRFNELGSVTLSKATVLLRFVSSSHAARAVVWLTLLAAATRTTSAAAQQAAAPSLGEHTARPKLTKPPKLLKFVEAPYPESEKSAGKQAAVVLQISISASGSVDGARVLQSAGFAFDEAALAAVERFLFEPAEIDDRPAPIRIQYRYEFVLKEAAPTVGTLEGTVRVRGSGQPLVDVRVELDNGAATVTDERGHFSFADLEPGERRVTLSRDDLKPLMTQERIEAGQKLDASYEVDLAPAAPSAGEESDDLEIVIVAPTLTKQVVSTKVEAEQARRVAGTQGDVLKIVENMPGVARASAGSGQVVVWGASPEDTRVYVDDVRVPLLYHFGGLRSVVHTDLVQSVELVPGGYGSSYGRGLGGLVTVSTRDPDPKACHLSAQLDVLDASVAGSGKVAGDWTFAAGARRSHLDDTLSAVSDEDLGEYFPIPTYYDGQVRLRRQLGPKRYIELGGLLSSDNVSRSVGGADPAERKTETRDLYFDRLYARYVSTEPDGSEVRLTPWIGRDHGTLTASFGGTPTELSLRSVQFGVRLSTARRLSNDITGNVGLDLEGSRTKAARAGSVSTPPREGDARVFGQPPSDQINSSDWKAVVGSAAPYAELDLATLGGRLHVVPGFRLEPYFVNVSRRVPEEADQPPLGGSTSDLALQPRLSLRYAPSERASFKAAWGKYFQAPQVEDLSAVFGNPLLSVAEGNHYLLSNEVTVLPKLVAETTAFYSRSRGLAVRNPALSPSIAQALVGTGEGRAFGAQLLLRRARSRRFFGWLAYTLMRSERRDSAGAPWRIFDFDQTHVLTALASYELGWGVDVGVRFRYATGYPRTPIIGSYYDARHNLYQPVLGARNSIRIPDFAQLDVRASKTFELARSKLELYADVQNVSNRENAEELVYDQTYSERRRIRGLPILPVVGARWEL